jgi:sorting nexin-4
MSDFASMSWEANAQPSSSTDPHQEEDNVVNNKDNVNRSSDNQEDIHHEQVDDNQIDNVYFNLTISDPQKEQDGSQNAYISYLITTDTNSPSFQLPVAKVRRRFSDFVYLYMKLCAEYPACTIPPLPDRQRLEYLKGDRFGYEFTLKRATSLGRFLTRIAHHPSLKKSRTFYTFLESSEWNAFKRHKAATGRSLSQDGVFDGLSDTLLNAFSKVNNQSKELVDVKEKADKLDDNLGNLEKTFSRVARRQGDIVHDLEEFAQQTTKLASLEPNLGYQVSEFARGIQDYARATYLLREQIDGDYIVSLRDMQNYILALKGLIKQREQKQLDYEALTDYLNKANAEKSNALAGGGTNFIMNKVEDFRGVNHEQAHKERLRKLEVRIEELTKEAESAKEVSGTFEEFALNEIAIFERIKYLEMKDTMKSLAENNITFYEGLIKGWEGIAHRLEDNSAKSD